MASNGLRQEQDRTTDDDHQCTCEVVLIDTDLEADLGVWLRLLAILHSAQFPGEIEVQNCMCNANQCDDDRHCIDISMKMIDAVTSQESCKVGPADCHQCQEEDTHNNEHEDCTPAHGFPMHRNVHCNTVTNHNRKDDQEDHHETLDIGVAKHHEDRQRQECIVECKEEPEEPRVHLDHALLRLCPSRNCTDPFLDSYKEPEHHEEGDQHDEVARCPDRTHGQGSLRFNRCLPVINIPQVVICSSYDIHATMTNDSNDQFDEKPEAEENSAYYECGSELLLAFLNIFWRKSLSVGTSRVITNEWTVSIIKPNIHTEIHFWFCHSLFRYKNKSCTRKRFEINGLSTILVSIDNETKKLTSQSNDRIRAKSTIVFQTLQIYRL